MINHSSSEFIIDPPVVNPEQAVIVRRIYRSFMEGKTAGAIAKEITVEGVPTPAGKNKWWASTINSILQNEKYRGLVLLQKCYTTDSFLVAIAFFL